MISVTSKQNCCGCFACADICPKGCIEMKADEEGFWYPCVDTSKCIDCGLCEQACPTLNSPDEIIGQFPIGYAVINKDENIRLASSSGGVFSLLANQIINDGGIVFGAAMSEDCRSVIHIGVDSLTELERLRGSKYVQSSIGDIYIKAQEALRNDQKVLFTGTPCQIEGLHSFLRKDYENLLCMDFICHGVPSPKVWKKYICYREKQANSSTRQIFFRHKKYGWKTFAVLFKYTNNTVYTEKYSKDLYMRSFLSNSCLRPSCYNCHFRKLNRISDITVADYWGIQKQYPDMDDDMGTSLVMIHTEKGKNILEMVNESAKMIPIYVERALEDNKSMIESPSINMARSDFMANIDKMDFDKLVKKFIKEPITFKNIIKWILRKTNMEIFVRNIFKI